MPEAHTMPQQQSHMDYASASLSQALRFWLKLGLIRFGGPRPDRSRLHQELVERRRWISECRFLHALNFCMLLPGPEAQQLAIYFGWLLHGTRGRGSPERCSCCPHCSS